jgi:hypothetical protein
MEFIDEVDVLEPVELVPVRAVEPVERVEAEEPVRVVEPVRAVEEPMCTICLEAMVNPDTQRCGHTFCEGCVYTWTTHDNTSCPLCRAAITDIPPLYFNRQTPRLNIGPAPQTVDEWLEETRWRFVQAVQDRVFHGAYDAELLRTLRDVILEDDIPEEYLHDAENSDEEWGTSL